MHINKKIIYVMFFIFCMTYTSCKTSPIEDIKEEKKPPVKLKKKTITPHKEEANAYLIHPEHSGTINSVCFSPDGKLLASGSDNNTIKLWDIKDGALIRTFKGETDFVISLSFSPDSKRIASETPYGTINLWDIKKGNLIEVYPDWDWQGFHGYLFSRHPKLGRPYFVTDKYEKSFKLWDIKDAAFIRTFVNNVVYIYLVSFSSSGNRVAYKSIFNKFSIWNVKDGSLIMTFNGHSKNVNSLSFSPDDNYIVSGGDDNNVKLWNVNDGTLIRTFKGHTDSVNSVCFSPDGSRIASGSSDNTIRIWDTTNENNAYIFVSFPDNEWFVFQAGQPYYNSSKHGDALAAVRLNTDIFRYKPLQQCRALYKKNSLLTLQEKPIKSDNKHVQIKLYCMIEGKKHNAYNIDEDIKVFTNCLNKVNSFKFENYQKMFTGQVDCPPIYIHSQKFENQTIYSKTNNSIKMNLNKPVLYVLINPSNDLNQPPLNFSEKQFEQMKTQLRLMSNKLDKNQKYRFWSDRWSRTYFYTQHKGEKPILLSNNDIFATKWTDPDFVKSYNTLITFNNSGISCQQLIEDVSHFFNGFSVSDDLHMKGAALIITGTPKTSVSVDELNILEQQLAKNNYCSLIVQFGKQEKMYTPNHQFKHLKLMELNLEKEFYNQLLKGAFEKILIAFEFLVNNQQVVD